ncbi:MAG TPA: ribosome maturation factor RimP [Thermoanaerobaculia bacterium]|jgi:ribosome maturation factor RimP|nr:ribosome maturation factor RimP [Thermoanaerobaculia bacterium]
MTATTSRIAELRPELEQIAAAAGCELVHVELKGGVLRLILDRPEGVNLADCELVSKQASAYLDVADFGRSRYVLEVSSPGLDRQLYKAADVERFLGKLARVSFTDPGDGAKKTVVGRLQELQRGEDTPNDEALVVLVDDKSGERTEVRWKDIRTARLEIEL